MRPRGVGPGGDSAAGPRAAFFSSSVDLCQSVLRGRTTDGKGLGRRRPADVERVMGSREGEEGSLRRTTTPATRRTPGLLSSKQAGGRILEIIPRKNRPVGTVAG